MIAMRSMEKMHNLFPLFHQGGQNPGQKIVRNLSNIHLQETERNNYGAGEREGENNDGAAGK